MMIDIYTDKAIPILTRSIKRKIMIVMMINSLEKC